MKRSSHLLATSLFVSLSLGCPAQVAPLDSTLPPPEFETRKHPLLDATAGAPEPAPAPKAQCNPPYYFEGGIRKIKRECL